MKTLLSSVDSKTILVGLFTRPLEMQSYLALLEGLERRLSHVDCHRTYSADDTYQVY